MLTAYAILAVGSAITGCDLLQILMHYIGHPVWANAIRADYSAAFLPFVPDWLTVTDLEALWGYYNGNSSMYRLAVLRACLRHRLATVIGWLAFLALSIALLPLLPRDFIPRSDRCRSALSI